MSQLIQLSWRLAVQAWRSVRKVQVLGQHRHDAGNLLLGTKAWGVGSRLKVQRHLMVDSGHDLHDIQHMSVALQHLTQRLHEPGTIRCVPPWVVALGEQIHCYTVVHRSRGQQTQSSEGSWGVCVYLGLWSRHIGSRPPQVSSQENHHSRRQSQFPHPVLYHDKPDTHARHRITEESVLKSGTVFA